MQNFPQQSQAPPESRRRFLAVISASIGALLALVPGMAGILVLLDPLKRNKGEGTREAVKVTTLEALPENGSPRKFSIIRERKDAWTLHPKTPVGAVYLRRTSPKTVEALNVVCPHAGCFVDFQNEKNQFHCPCHDSSFALDGSINDKDSPSPRPMDRLDVEIRNDADVWVHFKNFQPGHPEQLPVT